MKHCDYNNQDEGIDLNKIAYNKETQKIVLNNVIENWNEFHVYWKEVLIVQNQNGSYVILTNSSNKKIEVQSDYNQRIGKIKEVMVWKS